MNKAIELALRTWYPKDHPLHLCPLHPAMGLVGEVGEWINKHKKDKFKPGYTFTREDELDELGDIWYYLRILIYQVVENNKYDFDRIDKELNDIIAFDNSNIDILMIGLVDCSSGVFTRTVSGIGIDLYWLIRHFKELLLIKNTTFDELTALNWEKLKPGSERGEEWKKAWQE